MHRTEVEYRISMGIPLPKKYRKRFLENHKRIAELNAVLQRVLGKK